MTDNEIIKALESCVQYTITDVTTYKGMPLDEFSQAVLDLVNRKKEEIDRLNVENESLRMAGNSLKIHLKKAEEENDKLYADIDELMLQKDLLFDEAMALIERAGAEAIKKFAEKIQRHCTSVELNEYINMLVEEEIGEENDD